MIPELLRFQALQEWQSDLKETLDQPFVLLFDELPLSIALSFESVGVKRSPAYLRRREDLWRQKKTEYGDKLWNGRVSTVNRLCIRDRVLSMSLSDCEYKDIVFQHDVGPSGLQKLFGRELINIHAFTVALPITEDADAILGVVGKGTLQKEGSIDLIGGALNLDEHSVTSFRDIQEITARELQQEIGLEVAAAKCLPVSLNVRYGCCFFLFMVPVDGKKVEFGFHPNDEIKELMYCRLDDFTRLGPLATNDLAFVTYYSNEMKRFLPI